MGSIESPSVFLLLLPVGHLRRLFEAVPPESVEVAAQPRYVRSDGGPTIQELFREDAPARGLRVDHVIDQSLIRSHG